MIKVLHIIQALSGGGACRSMIATAKYSSQCGNVEHRIISLLQSESQFIELAELSNIKVLNAPERQEIIKQINQCDIVQIHFWNNPHLYHLLRSDLPAMRLLIWFHIAGDHAPQIITSQLLDFTDFALASSPYHFEIPIWQKLSEDFKRNYTGLVYDSTDFDRLSNFTPKSHQTFNVGYIGTVNFVKMHPDYVTISAKVDIPNVRFIVCGGGISNYLAQQAKILGASEKFDFRGYVEDIKSVLEILDVFGYPLCEDNYSTAELVLQEVMYCGIPPVIFPYGGAKCSVIHDETGLIVNSEKEYKEAIEYLYHHPYERKRLGDNARQYALEVFGAENAAKAINPIYERLMQQPKRDRIWGIPVDASLLDIPLTLEDLTGNYHKPTPAELFIEGLGNTKPEFQVSMTSQDINELFDAEEKIALSSPLVRSTSSGGIINYSSSYPNDAYLRLWSGLVLEESQQYSQAIENYIKAIDLKFNHWRVIWYLARVAEKANDLDLANKAIDDVLNFVPDFVLAQELLERITNENQFSINFQTSNFILFPNWQQSEERLYFTFTEVFKNIASHPLTEEITLIIDTTKADSEEDASLFVSGVTMNLALEEGIELADTTEIAFVGNLTVQQWEKLFEQMEANQTYQLPFSTIIQFENVPESALKSYCQCLLKNCEIFLNNGDADKYLDYYDRLIQYIAENIERNAQSKLWHKIAEIAARYSHFIPCYFNDRNMKQLYTNRAKILESDLRIKNFPIEYEFSPKESDSAKIKIGILSAHYTVQTETFSTLPVYNHLDRDKFDITLFTFGVTNHRLEKYCFGHADRVVELPVKLSEQLDLVRSYDLDIIFIGTNITAVSNPTTYLAIHKLARIQIVDPNSPVPTGMPSIDYYITSKLSESLPEAEEHYTEQLITLDIPPQCFDFGTEGNLKGKQVIKREDLGLKSEQIVFVSGANFYKIIPEVEETWIQILAQASNSVLVLYPFNPNWSDKYAVSQFQKRISNTLKKYNINQNRLILLEPVEDTLDIRERLKVCDLYLDSFPYSGMTSMLDPLSVNLPTLVYSGKTARSQKAASILRYFELNDLIAYALDEYVEKAVLIAQNPELRQSYRTKIEAQMQQSPSFLDSKKYSQEIEKVFINLYEQYQEKQISKQLNLTEINYLIIPNWQSNEEELSEELSNLILQLANNTPHEKDHLTTLVIDTTGISEEDANLFLSALAMNLIWEQELDLENKINFAFLDNLNEQHWQQLVPYINAKITLNHENSNPASIAQSVMEDNIVDIHSNNNNYAIFPNWQEDEEQLLMSFSNCFEQISQLSQEQQAHLVIDINQIDYEEANVFLSNLIMLLILEEEQDWLNNVVFSLVKFKQEKWEAVKIFMKQTIAFDNNSLPIKIN